MRILMRNRIGNCYFIIINEFPIFIELKFKKLQPSIARILWITLLTVIN